jgi:hypothetical protein
VRTNAKKIAERAADPAGARPLARDSERTFRGSGDGAPADGGIGRLRITFLVGALSDL